MGKALTITIISIIAIIIIAIAAILISSNFETVPKQVEVNTLEITNVYRNCETNSEGNYMDTTLQTTINVETKEPRNPVRINSYECTLRIGANNIEGFSLNRVDNVDDSGITNSGQYMITGGDLPGDQGGILTFCCQDICDTINLELCS